MGKPSQETIAAFMYGSDDEQRIVNLTYNNKEDFVTIFYRDENDQKCQRKDPFKPFVWATRAACLKLKEKMGRDALVHKMDEYKIGVKQLSTEDSEGKKVASFENGYIFQFYAKAPMSYYRFLEFFKECGNPIFFDRGKKFPDGSYEKTDRRSDEEQRQYLMPNAQEQYLISTGKRFFKGYNDYDDILRMIFDLETEGLNPEKHRIKLNGVKLNRTVVVGGRKYTDWGRIYRLTGTTKAEKDASELQIIKNMLVCIKSFQPDIITAHNGEVFDWNFLIVRAEKLGTTMKKLCEEVGLSGYIYKEKKSSILKLGGEIESFYRTIVPNTIVTDSMHAVRRAQAVDSSFKRADLKYATRYLNLKKENRVYTPGKQIDNILIDTKYQYAFNDKNGDWYRYDPTSIIGQDIPFKEGKDGDRPFVMHTRNYVREGYELKSGKYIIERYLLDDLWECDKVEYSLNGTDFMLCKIIPVTFSRCCTMGTASQWKAIMMAWSYENDLAIPLAKDDKIATGGLSRLMCTGLVKKVVKFDYNSLYPSIELSWGISDENDLRLAMLSMLEFVLTTREKYKKLKKVAEKKVNAYLSKMTDGETLTLVEENDYKASVTDFKINNNNQMVVKKLGNSFFGSLSSSRGSVFPWRSSRSGEQTTATGRQCLRLMISHFHALGYQPIVGDTDGFNFKLADTFRYTEEHPYIGKGLSRETKEGEKYIGFEADVAEFNDVYMRDFHYNPLSVNKMGLGIDEIVASTINFSRKNYADYFPNNPYPDDVKLVGNTIKSKKIPIFLENFINKGIRMLLRDEGQDFLNYYYDYLEQIYNYKIPLKDIATKGRIKKSLKEYQADLKVLTKTGKPKHRQAWYELALRENIKVDNGDTIYYINVGTTKSQSDIKTVKTYYDYDENKKTIDITKTIDKEWKLAKTTFEGNKDDFIKTKYPNHFIEEEIQFHSMLVPEEIIESEVDVFCNEENGIEYNTAKYIDMFNKRIKPLLVCFSTEIRNQILINNPKDRKFFTEEQCRLVSGEPNKASDQDTYEQLMKMEDKEIRFWMRYDMIPPFVEECGMGTWEEIKQDYLARMEQEKQLGIDIEKKQFQNEIDVMSFEEWKKIFDSADDDSDSSITIPSHFLKIATFNEDKMEFMSKNYPDIVIGTLNDLLDKTFDDDSDDFEEVIEIDA